MKKSQRGGKFWHVNGGGESEQRGREAPTTTQQKEESSTFARTGDCSCHAQRPDDGGGWDARSWTGAGCFECVRSTECDVIGLQETRRSGHSDFSQAGYSVYCSGECGGENGGKKGQGGVGLAVRTSITRAARPPEFISDAC